MRDDGLELLTSFRHSFCSQIWFLIPISANRRDIEDFVYDKANIKDVRLEEFECI